MCQILMSKDFSFQNVMLTNFGKLVPDLTSILDLVRWSDLVRWTNLVQLSSMVDFLTVEVSTVILSNGTVLYCTLLYCTDIVTPQDITMDGEELPQEKKTQPSLSSFFMKKVSSQASNLS